MEQKKAWVKPEIKFLKAKTLEDRPELLEDPVIRAFYESWKERENKTRESGAVSIQPKIMDSIIYQRRKVKK